MEDADDLKQEHQSVTVNFENLHANMALENQVGDVAAEVQKEQKEEPAENNGNSAENRSTEKLEETGDSTELNQAELKGGGQEISIASTPENDAAKLDQTDETTYADGALDQTELKGGDINLTSDDGNTSAADNGNGDHPKEIAHGHVAVDQTELKGADMNPASDITNTSEADNGNVEKSEKIKDETDDVNRTEFEGRNIQLEVTEGSAETKGSCSEAANADVNTPGYTEQKTEKTDAEPDNVEEIAKGIIKSAVDGAAEQVSLEKSGSNTDIPKTSEENLENEPEWLDILGNGLLRKKILRSGIGVASRPLRESEVTIRYMARLLPPNGDEIVEAEDSMSFILGEQEAISAFDLAVAFMQKGEVSLVETDAKYAYEDEGKPPKIPPKAGLVFEIELLDVRPGPFSTDMELDRRLAWADRKRLKGNGFYSDKKYVQASIAYGRATKALEKGWMNEESEAGRIRINELRLKCYNNFTASRMKEEKWKDAMQSCRAAELLEPSNVKTLFRKGKIHCELGELDKGIAVLSKAEKLDPDNKTITAELAKQKRRLEKQNESRKKMYRRMLGTTPDESSTKPTSSQEKKQESNWFRNWGRVLGGTIAIGAVLVGVYIAQRS